MKKVVALFMFLALLMLASAFTPKSQAYTIGVQVGDWFTYKGTIVYWHADEGVPFPPHMYATILQVYNETDWIKYEVTEIKEAAHNVTFLVTNHWKNGTETQYTLEDNMDTSFTMMVIDADLGPGDMVRPEYNWGFMLWPPRYLNDTVEVEYIGGEPREVKVLDWVHPPLPFNPEAYTRQIYWWDNETGIQVRYEVHENSTAYDETFQPIGDYQYIATFELIDTSYGWGAVVPEYPKWPLTLLTLTAAAVPIIRYKRKTRLK
ncbi:MAG: hypothetical protein QHH12_02105 [Candidatus Bathyarchaeota archaeon]|jgi:hypothetical protein|nr:hypothetical protein [Candidatus Bathyarchaeota archaeon A05DMB-3]MDH7606550.1 hypothetical protein [Candidatus Bathyarchaeota archaeon]